MKLAIADPPYPPFIGSGGRKNRASRWYGDKQRSPKDKPADHHPDAEQWDDPAAHQALLAQLLDQYDGWALATSPDGLAVYQPLPNVCRIMAWIKPNACPGSHRLLSSWEPVIVYPPKGRRSNRGGVGAMRDVLVANAPRRGFHGAKPAEWTHWVLSALQFNPATDTIDDLFSGSGAVQQAIDLFTRTAPRVADPAPAAGGQLDLLDQFNALPIVDEPDTV